MAWVSSARAPLRRISVRESLKAPGWVSLITLLSDTAYHSFIGEVEALNTTTIRRLTPSCRHQILTIALHFDRGAVRVERLREAVTIIKGLLGGERLTLAGSHYRLIDHTIFPVPIQKPHPPILIGGNGRVLLTLASMQADIVGLSGITFRNGGAAPPDLSGWRVSEVDERVRFIRVIAGEERSEEIELNALVQRVVVTEDRRRSAEKLTSRWKQLTADEILQSPYVLIGTVEQIIEDLQDRRKRWGISYYNVHEPYMDALAPIVARLAGK